MRKFVFLALCLLPLACGNPKPAVEQKVMARAVPERADDFVFENDLIAGRFYGKALEGNPTSPGLDIWVKLPGRLVADEWYAGAMEDPDYYHHDHGGKDCYKVAVSLGGGASVPYVDGRYCFPATNYRSSEVLEPGPDCVRFALEYPEWEVADGVMVTLRKEVTLEAGSYFADVADTYIFSGTDSLTVAAGYKCHRAQGTIVDTFEAEGRSAIWEHASDQSIEPEDGFIGVGIIVPGASEFLDDAEGDHRIFLRTLTSGEALQYRIGSCWSKGDVKTAADWFALVAAE